MSELMQPGELICFGFSHFDCEARRSRQLDIFSSAIDITVQIAKGTRYQFVCGANLTMTEIQEYTVYKILDLLREMEADVGKYAQELRDKIAMES